MWHNRAGLLYLLAVVVTCTGQGCIYSDKGQEYLGTKDVTHTGKLCKRWDSVTLGQYNIDFEDFPDLSLSAVGRYCRKPDNSTGGPWCFTEDPGTLRENCGLPRCDCKTTEEGTEYVGKTSLTSDGISCQAWVSDSPNSHTHHGDHLFPDRTEAEAKNYCRNPDDEYGPWCFTSTRSGWEYCYVSECVCRTDEMGSSYIGKISQTKSGIECQHWDRQAPQNHNMTGTSNYCRNPNNDPNGPWCFTTDPEVRKESCDVPRCFFKKMQKPVFDRDPSKCKAGQTFNSYIGNANTTVSGKVCQRWDSQTPHSHSFTDPALFPDSFLGDAANYCRNPDESSTGPWCYTVDSRTQREACLIKPCECKTTVKGVEYSGQISRTRTGRTCQRWEAQSPHSHNDTDAASFPDSSLSDAANFCRNPDRKHYGPWCYTTDIIDKWDFCRVPLWPESLIVKSGKPTTTHLIEELTSWLNMTTPAAGPQAQISGFTAAEYGGIGGGVSCVLLIGVACVIVWMLKKKMKKKQNAKPPKKQDEKLP